MSVREAKPLASNSKTCYELNEKGLIQFEAGKIILGRWKVIARLGAGGCGSVWKVENLQQKGYMAAMKVEPRHDNDHGVLKLEVSMLKQLKNCKHIIRLIESGYRTFYNYMVITLCGYDLMSLKKQTKNGFCESTVIRIGINALYAIKQVHEAGYVHRDVKPGNIMNGAVGRDKRMFFLIDYGMNRSFIIRNKKKVTIRKPRPEVLFRGTLRYCSLNVHERKEQGRVDDLWAMLYMLVEIYIGLPWHKKDEKEVMRQKRIISDAELFNDCPPEFTEMAVYLRTLGYQSRPDYFKLYEMLMATMRREKYSFLEEYDWEEGSKPADLQTALEYSQREKASKKPLPAHEVEFLHFPWANPTCFKENVLEI